MTRPALDPNSHYTSVASRNRQKTTQAKKCGAAPSLLRSAHSPHPFDEGKVCLDHFPLSSDLHTSTFVWDESRRVYQRRRSERPGTSSVKGHFVSSSNATTVIYFFILRSPFCDWATTLPHSILSGIACWWWKPSRFDLLAVG